MRIVSKRGKGLRAKERSVARRKDNAETQSALRFAEDDLRALPAGSAQVPREVARVDVCAGVQVD